MENEVNIKISGWVRERLERIKIHEGHSSYDSVIRTLILRSIGIESGGVSEELEELYDDADGLRCMVSVGDRLDRDGPAKTLEWVRKEDPDFLRRLLALRKKVCGECPRKEPCANRKTILKAIEEGRASVNETNFEVLIWPEGRKNGV